jgi:hypothetical protein
MWKVNQRRTRIKTTSRFSILNLRTLVKERAVEEEGVLVIKATKARMSIRDHAWMDRPRPGTAKPTMKESGEDDDSEDGESDEGVGLVHSNPVPGGEKELEGYTPLV